MDSDDIIVDTNAWQFFVSPMFSSLSELFSSSPNQKLRKKNKNHHRLLSFITETSFITPENSRLDFKQEISRKNHPTNQVKSMTSRRSSPTLYNNHQPPPQHLKLCGFRHHFLTCKVQEVWHIAASHGDLVAPLGRDGGPTFSWPVHLRYPHDK